MSSLSRGDLRLPSVSLLLFTLFTHKNGFGNSLCNFANFNGFYPVPGGAVQKVWLLRAIALKDPFTEGGQLYTCPSGGHATVIKKQLYRLKKRPRSRGPFP